jgi:mono/diheme cytochrome c family protein
LEFPRTLILLIVSAVGAWAQMPDDAGPALYPQIQPVLQKQCLACHNPQLRKGGLDLSSREALLHGGDSGPGIVPGNAKESLLYKLIAREQEPAMPYRGTKLPDAVVAQFAAWINIGAPYGSPAAKELGKVLFTEYIRPLLEAKCLSCHGAGPVKQSGFDISTREGLLHGGEKGPGVVPGHASESALYKRVKHDIQPGMPFQGARLSDELIAHIADWINAGAPYSGSLNLEAARNLNTHWAFQVPKKPPVPAVKNAAWVRNPIDAFVAAEQEKHGLHPMSPAPKNILLRRVYLDLIGLPPTQDELRAFLADRSPHAYEKVVDKLLASPEYGERWGRHWMDIWRYSDVYGSADRSSRPHIWHWRDWIIDSLNQDKGYDQMIEEMFAGDELAPTEPKVLAGTGFLGRNYYLYNRDLWLQDTIEHTASAFLGLTLRCARCHDHKYNPITQEEYYRFRAFFEPEDIRVDRLPGTPDLAKDGLPRAFEAEPRPAHLDSPKFKHVVVEIYPATYKYIRGNPDAPDKEHPLSPGVPAILGGDPIKIQPVSLPLEAKYPDIRPFVERDLVTQAKHEIEKSELALRRANTFLAKAKQRLADAAANPTPSVGGPPKTAGSKPSEISFKTAIIPILEKNCFGCHNADKQASGLVLESEEFISHGGAVNGPVVLPGNGAESPLILYLKGEKQPRMPLRQEPLPDEQVALVSRWIDQLPEEDPQTGLHKAEEAAALAEKHLAWARAYLPGLEARIAADNAKYSDPQASDAEALAETAQKLDRQASLLKAEEDILQAQQKLTDALNSKVSNRKEEKAREARVDAAVEDLETSQAALAQATTSYTPVGTTYPAVSSGRRLALARWMASRNNPLTARVAVNHIWLRHFGKAIVPTVANFGMNGTPPTHPQLLDWLACEFMDKNWSMKQLHRLMVTSNTYRMQSWASDAKDPDTSLDPDNKYLWRMNSRRMDAEVVRDSMLYTAGLLDLKMGGPEIDENKGQESHRRSVYFHQTPDNQMVFLRVFDGANPIECYERAETVTPQQALALANSKLSFNVADVITTRLGGEGPAPTAFVAGAFEAVLDRPPSDDELRLSQQYLARQEERFRSAEKQAVQSGAAQASTSPVLRARADLVHALLNHDDFVTTR